MENAKLIVAILALAVSGFSVIYASQANQLSKIANENSNSANVFAAVANNLALEANNVAKEANSIARESNDIARKSYDTVDRANLPIITAHSYVVYGDNKSLQTEKIAVNNDGGKLTNFWAGMWFIMNIRYGGKEVDVPMDGYFVFPEYTLASQHLLATAGDEGNRAKYQIIANDFMAAAAKDKHNPSIWEKRLINAQYIDLENTRWNKFFWVYQNSYPYELSENDGKSVLNTLEEVRNSAKSKGIQLYYWQLSGSQLWNWYKTTYLQ